MYNINTTQILNLFKNCQFDQLVSEDYLYSILEYLPQDFQYTYATGTTKITLCPKDSNYVIKIPCKGYFYEYTTKFEEFKYACADSRNNWNYCFKEQILYQRAKNQKVAQCFVKNFYIGTICNHPIYIQPKIATTEPRYPANKKRVQYVKNFCDTNRFYCFNPSWLANCLKYYGFQTFYNLLSFIKENHISDLRVDNVGYDSNDRPYIFDYGGFNE